ncbi:MAG: hypothetical protein ACREUF_06275 [Solimonas sp.]
MALPRDRTQPEVLTPDIAGILEEARQLFDAGEMTLEAFARLEERYRDAIRNVPEPMKDIEPLLIFAPAAYFDT